MQPEPPQLIDPMRLARQGARLAGRLQISKLPRLHQATVDNSDGVVFSLEFGRDSQGIHCIIGSVATSVTMRCQRCMRPMPLELQGDIRLGIVQGYEEAKRLPPEYEPLLVQQEPLLLAELIEDEVMLLLPFAPMHDEAECPVDVASSSEEESVPDMPETYKPFAGLDKLRRDD